jgi:hypothetical protein
MTKFITIVDGIAKLVEESTILPAIYEELLTVTDVILTGAEVHIPNARTYQGLDLEVKLNGQHLTLNEDYLHQVPNINKTYVKFLFDLEPGDKVNFRKVRDL